MSINVCCMTSLLSMANLTDMISFDVTGQCGKNITKGSRQMSCQTTAYEWPKFWNSQISIIFQRYLRILSISCTNLYVRSSINLCDITRGQKLIRFIKSKLEKITFLVLWPFFYFCNHTLSFTKLLFSSCNLC